MAQPTLRVDLIHATPNAEELLIFTKNTRLLSSPDDYKKIFALPPEERADQFKKVFSSISSPLEFVDFIFLISNVTRAFTHQIVRHRVGVAFAQQAQRVVDMQGFSYMIPEKVLNAPEDARIESVAGVQTPLSIYEGTMDMISDNYRTLHDDFDIPAQDARGVLPTNVHTNILFKCNLRVLLEICHIRMCVRAQGEFQQVVLAMRDAASEVYPWVYNKMGPLCISKGICAFPVFDRCPIKANRPWLNGPNEKMKQEMREEHAQLMGKYEPQPLGDGK